jgi:hypothetical protein
MAGKTLPGIGDDESGEHEVATDPLDKSGQPDKTDGADTGRHTDKVVPAPSPARSTDRMPLSTIYNGPAIDFTPTVDEDKVAEGLKKLRSLDEPLGPIPSSMPTLKEGMPVVDAPAPAKPAVSVAELIRARGTAHGHALSGPGLGQGLVPMTVDDRLKGTLLGHSLHLPDLPEPGDESRPAEVRSVAQLLPSGPAATTTEMPADFSNGDSSFFDSEPVNTELEPEPQPRSTIVARGAVFVAIISIFVVAAVAWVKVHKGAEAAAVDPQLARAPDPAAPPAPVVVPDNAAAPAPTVVPNDPAAAIPAAAAPAAAAPSAEPAPVAVPIPPPPAPSVDDEAAAAALAPPPPAPRHTREVPAAPGERPARAATHSSSSRLTESHHTAPAPRAAGSGKPGKVMDDPDGTLPLDE